MNKLDLAFIVSLGWLAFGLFALILLLSGNIATSVFGTNAYTIAGGVTSLFVVYFLPAIIIIIYKRTHTQAQSMERYR